MIGKQAKAIVALLLVGVGEAITYGVIPERYRAWAQIVLALGTYAGVYRVPNTPPADRPPSPPPAPAPRDSAIAAERPPHRRKP